MSLRESFVNQRLWKRGLLAAAVLLFGTFLVIYLDYSSQPAPDQAPLMDIQSIETLHAQFNDDAGKTRLILLLSPT
jgi:hypothetical protein